MVIMQAHCWNELCAHFSSIIIRKYVDAGLVQLLVSDLVVKIFSLQIWVHPASSTLKFPNCEVEPWLVD